MGSTLQIGDLSVLATLTGIPAVGNFRPADVSLGGQGAPLVPWTDAALLSHPTKNRCIQNIGGIANVTYLPSGRRSVASGQKVIAFDTGPGNMLMDALISFSTNEKKRYDHNGQLAAQGTGTLDEKLFKHLQAHPYFQRTPPKSTGREDFGLPFAQHLLTTGHWPLTTLLHTVTRLTAWSITDAYRKFLPALPDELILCGGGADNPTLLRMLTEEFAAGKKTPAISRIDNYGIPNKAKEAASFALLAALPPSTASPPISPPSPAPPAPPSWASSPLNNFPHTAPKSPLTSPDNPSGPENNAHHSIPRSACSHNRSNTRASARFSSAYCC